MAGGNGAAPLAQGTNNMANKANSKAATAKPVARVRAATLVAKGGLPALARVAAATGNAPASAKRYGATVNGLTPAFAAATFTPTALGKQAIAANGGIGRNGQPTVMGLVAVALGNAIAANGGNSATGQQVALALLGNPQLMAATGGTKALGVHVTAANATAAKWAQGYVNGLCRPAHGLAKKA
jgi:hypothetical protein